VQFTQSTLSRYASRLSTPAGIFNVAAFRGVFYGSSFALQDLRWFGDLSDWNKHYLEAAQDDKEGYFVKGNCYGPNQPNQKTTVMENYWEIAQRWPKVLQSGKDNPNELMAYFKNLPNVGDLSALLMLGGLVECGFLGMLDAGIMGSLVVAAVDKGGKAGLQLLGLVGSESEAPDVTSAFEDLHQQIMRELNEERRSLIGYNVIMLEHAICKYKRLVGRKSSTGLGD